MKNKVMTVEQAYQFYLKKVDLSEDKMNPIQKIETRRAFYAGFTQSLVVYSEEIASIEDEEEAIVAMGMLHQECNNFWKAETEKHIEKG